MVRLRCGGLGGGQGEQGAALSLQQALQLRLNLKQHALQAGTPVQARAQGSEGHRVCVLGGLCMEVCSGVHGWRCAAGCMDGGVQRGAWPVQRKWKRRRGHACRRQHGQQPASLACAYRSGLEAAYPVLHACPYDGLIIATKHATKQALLADRHSPRSGMACLGAHLRLCSAPSSHLLLHSQCLQAQHVALAGIWLSPIQCLHGG